MTEAAGRRVRVIGIDPGLVRTGWGIVEADGNRLAHVAAGVIASDDARPLAERLCQLHDGLDAVLERYRPDEAAVEETFVNRNARSTLKLGLARGVALLVPARAGLPVAEYAANLIKKSVVGAGHADKNQVKLMIDVLLPGATGGNGDGASAAADAADALAVAICHVHHRATRRVWQAAAGAPGVQRS